MVSLSNLEDRALQVWYLPRPSTSSGRGLREEEAQHWAPIAQAKGSNRNPEAAAIRRRWR